MCVAEKLEIKNKVLYAIFNGAQMRFFLLYICSNLCQLFSFVNRLNQLKSMGVGLRLTL